jgi:hypothetical protein
VDGQARRIGRRPKVSGLGWFLGNIDGMATLINTVGTPEWAGLEFIPDESKYSNPYANHKIFLRIFLTQGWLDRIVRGAGEMNDDDRRSLGKRVMVAILNQGRQADWSQDRRAHHRRDDTSPRKSSDQVRR